MSIDNSQSEHSVADVIVRGLVERGVQTVFVMPGEQVSPLFESLFRCREQIRAVVVRHEQAAAYMAYGYAKATGMVGVLIVPPGPGVLNALAGLSVAYAASTPVMCLTGQIPLEAIGKRLGHLHELPDQLGALQSVVKSAARVSVPAEAAGIFTGVWDEMLTAAAGPVAIEIPSDVLRAPVEKAHRGLEKVSGDRLVAEAQSEDDFDRAAAWLKSARHPLIIVGSGAIGASEELRRLAERLWAPVLSNGGGRGVLDARHTLSLPMPIGHRFWKSADVILAIGTRFGPNFNEWGIDDSLKVIRIDKDRKRIEKTPFALGIVADAGEALKKLNQRLAGTQKPSREEEILSIRSDAQRELESISPQNEFVSALRSAIPEDGILVDEVTQIGYVCRIGYPVYKARTYITSSYQGALGYGYATALGAKISCPDRVVVSVNGDGSFLYTSNELATAVQHKIGAIAVVFNDCSFGNIAREQASKGYQLASSLHNPDFVALARSFGAFGQRVATPEELAAAISEAHGRELPTVIEVPVGIMPSPWASLIRPSVRGKAI